MFPRFTIRVVLLAVTAVALISIVAAQGLQGNAAAAGVAIGVASVAFTLLCHAAWYLAARLFGAVTKAPQEAPAPNRLPEPSQPPS